MTWTHKVFFWFALLLLVSTTGAQRTPPAGSEQYPYPNFSPSIAIIIVILIAALFFMGFFSIYIRSRNQSISAGRVSVAGIVGRSRRANRGLDRDAIDMFPTFAYSEVKDRKIGKGALECAVCLNEFEDDETLRLLPKCDHVFHPECIDAWLASHTTCPVCRSDLAIPTGEALIAVETPIIVPDELNRQSETNDVENAVSIRVDEGEDDPVQQSAAESLNPSRSINEKRPPRSGSVKSYLLSKLPRAHTTGHSLINPGENVERFTLRLPEEVRKEIMSRALNRTTSLLILPRETSSRRGYRTDEGSGRAKSYRRLESLEPVQKSEPWVFTMAPPFLVRGSSVTMGNNGEGTSSSIVGRGGFMKSLKKSFGRLNSRNSETSLASGDSARLAV